MLNPSLRFVILITNRIVINEKYRGEAVTNSNDGFNTKITNITSLLQIITIILQIITILFVIITILFVILQFYLWWLLRVSWVFFV